MTRVLLVCWDAERAVARAARLAEAGYGVEIWSDPRDGGFVRRAASSPPDRVVIDLDRAPARGRDVGTAFRRRKATRPVPLVFAGGDDAAVARVRRDLPDAAFTPWRTIRSALRRARSAPAPAVPGAMAGYAGTPLPRKLGIRGGGTLALLHAPRGFTATPGALPEGVTVRRRAGRPADVVVAFCPCAADLERRWEAAAGTTADGGRLWIAWPKKISPRHRDLTGDGVRAFGLARGWVDFKICAIDADWSGLCFARRRA